MNLIQRGDVVENYDMLIYSKTRDPVWINVSIVAIPGRREEFNTVVHIFRDITKRKRSEELLQELISTIELANQSGKDSLYTDTDIKVNPLEQQPKPGLTLSRRELEVLRLLAEGASTNAIAKELQISWATARKHIQNILAKLGLHTKLEAVSYAVKNNLI